ncbi:MAG: GNAT family N-acetyltransferase [Planctomycetes bacterium]|nr:GNAT family N-acetyltransferase [Planctomycetota bacterium]
MPSRWKETYDQRRVTAAQAVARIYSGDHLFVGTAAGEPKHLVQALVDRSAEVADLELIQFHPLGEVPYAKRGMEDRIRINSLFVSDAVRDTVAECRGDYTPALLSQLPGLFRTRKLPVNVALISVTPPDEHGYCSLGVSVDITRTVVDMAELVIAQVNPRMPRTFGSSFVHVGEIDLFVEHEEDLPILPIPAHEEVHDRIAAHISRLVPDGATIQVGAGRIPNAVIPLLNEKNDLGVHTELFSDGLMELAKLGVITGRRKTFHPGKIVASLAAGGPELYRYLDRNPSVEMHGSDYVNSIVNIAANHAMVAINSCLEVDLTGQVCADSLGYRFFSGMGGHADFIRGAALAPEGKPIIALPSTAKTAEGVVSRIVPALKEGAGVLTTRGDIHYVVTEHGVAYLHGKNIRERAMSLISIADPAFRQELLHAAKARRLVFAHQIIPPRGVTYPAELETTVRMEDGMQVLIRPVKPTDDELMKELFYSFSEKTRYLRFHRVLKAMPHARRQVFSNVDYRDEMAIVAVLVSGEIEEPLGVGRYMMDEGTKSAEIAVVVRDDWQGRGLGRRLFKRLASIAKDRGIVKFTGDVLAENEAMMSIFRNTGIPMNTKREDGVIHVEVDLTRLSTVEVPEPPAKKAT